MSRFMMYKFAVVLAAVAVAGAGPSGLVEATAPDQAGDPSQAVLEGRVVDLADGWGSVGACAELGERVECYRTEPELLAAHPELVAGVAFGVGSGMVAASSCSSSLRLYRSTGYGGSALYLTTRSVVQNLSSFGFDNDTSSYRVGACSAAFYSGANLAGSQYPGSTGANASASLMAGGWDNVVSSVIIF